MSAEAKLFIVEKRRKGSKAIITRIIFRTRAKARAFAADRNEKSKSYTYTVEPKAAIWGPAK